MMIAIAGIIIFVVTMAYTLYITLPKQTGYPSRK